MFAWINQRNRLAPLGDPSPLLQHLAGEFAPRVAGLWPDPHAAFLTAPSERRHLICIALAETGESPLPVDARQLLDLSLKRAIAVGVPDAPEGLRRVLSRLGETVWSAKAYAALLRVLAQGAAAKDIRHAGTVMPDQALALADLPGPLLRARIGGFGLTTAQAALLSEVYGLIASLQGETAAARAVERWAGIATAKALFEAAGDDLLPELPAPPFPGSDRLRPALTKADMRRLAVRYRNCLRTVIPDASEGRSAIYEWIGVPSAVVEITRDPVFGWRLEEARLANNRSVPPSVRQAITAELRSMGVHVGRSEWDVRNDLERAHLPRYRRNERDADAVWRFED